MTDSQDQPDHPFEEPWVVSWDEIDHLFESQNQADPSDDSQNQAHPATDSQIEVDHLTNSSPPPSQIQVDPPSCLAGQVALEYMAHPSYAGGPVPAWVLARRVRNSCGHLYHQYGRYYGQSGQGGS